MLRKETLSSISYLKWGRISEIPGAQVRRRDGEGGLKPHVTLCLQTDIEEAIRSRFSNYCDTQTLFLIFFFFWTVYLLLALDPLPGFLSIGYGNQSTGNLVILFPKPAIDWFSDLRDS